MISKTRLFIIALTLGPNSALATDCVNRNLETTTGNPMQSIPTYDQDGTGMCYAYAASQMMNCYLMEKNRSTSLRVHPATAAVRFTAAYDKQETLNGGFIDKAINATRAEFNYSYSSVAQNLTETAKNTAVPEAEVLHFIETLGKAMTNPTIRDQASLLSSKQAAANGSFAGPLYNYWNNLTSTAFNSIKPDAWCSKEDIASLKSFALSAPASSSLDIAFLTIFEEKHKSAKPLSSEMPAAKHLTGMSASEATIKETIRAHFAAKATRPLGLSFCSKVISDGTYRGLSGTGSSRKIIPKDKNGGKDCGPHAVLISGIRNNGGRCEYLIRNSWGTAFRSNSRLSCVCKNTATKAYSECPGNGLKDGKNIPNRANLKIVSCWIPEAEVAPNTTALDSL